MSFSFSFAGDDIEPADDSSPAAVVNNQTKPVASAFPVQGKAQLPPCQHELTEMLGHLPSKIAYGQLDVSLEDGTTMQIPRRELWDVRVQLMAEDDGTGSSTEGLGSHDVKTGVYEGGFKSWESSVDLVKVLQRDRFRPWEQASRVVELGCGTALPSLAIFQRTLSARRNNNPDVPALFMTVADYNPTVLQLVTLPNFILAWALSEKDNEEVLKDAFSMEGELELFNEVKEAFRGMLSRNNISLTWLSGGWSAEFVDLLYATDGSKDLPGSPPGMLILGAETIYSPFALGSFHETVVAILGRERAAAGGEGRTTGDAQALVGAKRLYFGVGGSLDDFVAKARDEGGLEVEQLKEETEGVRRGVVLCKLPRP